MHAHALDITSSLCTRIQVLEAEVEYIRLVKMVQDSFADVKLPFAEHQMKFLNKVGDVRVPPLRESVDLALLKWTLPCNVSHVGSVDMNTFGQPCPTGNMLRLLA